MGETLPPSGTHGLAPGYWREKTLREMSRAEWEALCDGCGKCCLVKLEDEDTGEVHLTRVACRELRIGTCRCANYATRTERVPGCLSLTPDLAATLPWLPSTCAYRLVAQGQELAWWHPLVSGSPNTVHEAGVSVRHMAVSETYIANEDVQNFIISD